MLQWGWYTTGKGDPLEIRIRRLPTVGHDEAFQTTCDRVIEAREAYKNASTVLRLLKRAKAAPDALAEYTANVDRLRAEYDAAEDGYASALKEGRT